MKLFWSLSLILVLFYAPIEAIEKGEKAPELEGKLMDGSGFYSVNSEKDQFRIFNFFSVGCEPCRREIPELARAFGGGSKAKLFLVNTWEEGEDRIKEFLGRLPVGSLRVLISPPSVRPSFKRQQDRDLIQPTTLVVGPGNEILFIEYGYSPDLVKKINRAVKR